MKIALFSFLLTLLLLLPYKVTYAVSVSDELQIVDCLLPGKVKQLGLKRTYVSRKIPVKVTANECAIRGGEFVLEDRASLVSSLKVWQEAATLGDKVAQYYVGEIYENGMEQEPDYQLARIWYEKSAEQGHAPAKISLGRLYEGGLGVEKDLIKAINYYREASGLEDESIAFASAFKAQLERDQNTIENLEEELEETKAQKQRLNQQVKALQQRLDIQKHQTSELETGVRQTEQALHDARQAVRKMPENHEQKQEVIAINQQLIDANQQLAEHKQLIAALQSELNLAKSGEQAEAFLRQELEQAEEKLTQTIESEQKGKAEITKLHNKIFQLKGQLDKLVPVEQMERLKQELLNQKNQMKIELQNQQDRIAQQQEYIEKLNSALQEAREEQQNTAAKTAYELANAQAELTKMLRTVNLHNQQVQQLQQEIALLQRTTQQAPSKLDIDSIEVIVQSILAQKEDFIAKSMQNLQADLTSARATVELLHARLKQQRQIDLDREDYIAKLKQSISRTKKDIQSSERVIKEKEIQLAAAQQRIRSLQSQLKAFPAQVSNLQTQLNIQRQRLSQAQTQVTQLTDNIASLNQEKSRMERKIDLLGVSDKPLINIRWPSVNFEDDTDGASSRVLAGSVVNVVGAVYPHKLIDKFYINGQEETLDNSGLFLKSVEVADTPVKISMRAIDMEGRENSKTLILTPSAKLDPELINTQINRPDVDFGKFYALVINNSSYDAKNGWQPLKTPQRDAANLSELLREKYGFEVEVVTDVTREEMLLALEKMRKKLTEKDNLLIYYAGHGYVDPENDQGYWIPVDGKSDSAVNWVSNASITDQIRAMSARNVMVISDSCYSGSLMRSGLVELRSGLPVQKRLRMLRDDINKVTRIAFTSGGLQPVADSIGNTKHSVFAGALISVLENNDELLDGQALATEVGVRVATLTADNIKQVPRYAPLLRGGHEGGEFYFVPVE